MTQEHAQATPSKTLTPPAEGSAVRGALYIAAASLVSYGIGWAMGLTDDLGVVSDRLALLGLIVLMFAIVFGFQYIVVSRPPQRPEQSRARDAVASDLNAAVARRLPEMHAEAAKDGFTVPSFLASFVHPREEAYTYMVPIAAFAATWAFLGARDGTSEFIATSAQVIPVLILALAIEGTVFRLRGDRTQEWTALSCLLLALMATGEVVAVNALMDGVPRGADVSMAAIVAGLAAVTTVAVFGHGNADSQR